jgi:tungstate transport system substrate-binding protein
MRQTKGSWVRRRTVLLLVAAVLASLLVAPQVASAYTPSTLKTSVVYMPVAKNFTVSGTAIRTLRGKKLSVEIRKPGRTFWTTVGSATASKTNGAWALKYMPKLGGKFYVRARYGTANLTRTAPLTVKKGPGVRYEVTLASTTSTRDSGLWEALYPAFRSACPEYSVKATFVGSGAAIALGGTCDADVLLVHSPKAEDDFMKGIVAGKPSECKGLSDYRVMYNDFVLVGPTANPADVTLGETAKNAFDKVATKKATFWSRNDNSGTNTKEKEIWATLGNPQTGQSWYKASGTLGMAQALAACNESGGYTLSDRGTWLNMVNLGTVKNLKIVNEGDAMYFNQYSVMQVTGARNWEGAQDFSRWIRSAQAISIIKEYGVSTFGTALFTPNPSY